MNQIISNLFIGDESSLQFLKQSHIHTVLSVGCEFKRENGIVPRHEDINYYCIPVDDEEDEQINKYFVSAIRVIEHNLQHGRRILVHCSKGISRSATIIIAYLMFKLRMNYNQAHDYLKSIRPIIRPNNGFIMQLQRLEKYGKLKSEQN